MAFGQKRSAERTVALVDIENGSVGAALARLSPQDAPRLLAEVRVTVPFARSRDSATLFRALEKALEEALLHVSEVATRLRINAQQQGKAARHIAQVGDIERAAVFLSVPWASMRLDGTTDFVPYVQQAAQASVRSMFGDKPVSFHPFGTAAALGTDALFSYEEPVLLCLTSHELSELLLMHNHALAGRATVPLGINTFVRTAMAHAGVSPQEARSWFTLAADAPHSVLPEPFAAAQTHFSEEITGAAKELLAFMPAGRLVMLAPEPAAHVLARSLGSHTPLSEVFSEGATVQAMRTHHVMPYLAAHAPQPDLPLMLEALFADAKFGI